MLNFRTWLEGAEEDKDVRKTLAKVPKAHAALLRGYKFHWEDGNTLKGDNEHIGYIKGHPDNVVVIAAPLNYGREYTLLHELGHLVWAKFMTPELRNQWQQTVSKTKTKGDQNNEEEFCMTYAQCFASNRLLKYEIPQRVKFMNDFLSKNH